MLNKLWVGLLALTSAHTMVNGDPANTISFAGVEFRIIKSGESDHRFIWLHGDEKTAEMALEYHIQHYPGSAFFIRSEDREISLATTKVDPNRLFSRPGAKNTLQKFKTDWKVNNLSDVLDQLDSTRELFLKTLLPSNGGLLIAVHNNFRGYNVRMELPASRLNSIKPKQNPRDFILCTNESDFQKLADGPFNVILQDKLPDLDDGSLSWAALKNKIRYVNIETRLGWLSQQKKMLRFVEETIK
nr:hypothetical protein [Candidatus Neomarinimicrobiota bacterium]